MISMTNGPSIMHANEFNSNETIRSINGSLISLVLKARIRKKLKIIMGKMNTRLLNDLSVKRLRNKMPAITKKILRMLV